MSTLAHRQNIISRTRQAATALLAAAGELEACKAAWERGIGTETTDADFMGANQGIVKTDINKALGVARDGLRACLVSADGKKFEDIAM